MRNSSFHELKNIEDLTHLRSKTCVKLPLSNRPKIVFQDLLLLNAGQKYCRMLQGEHSAVLSTFIKLPFSIKIFVLSIFEWPYFTCFTVLSLLSKKKRDKIQGLLSIISPFHNICIV